MKLLFCLLSAITISGCASFVQERMSYTDLSVYTIDCTRYTSQTAFLRSQLVTRDEKFFEAYVWPTVVGNIANDGLQQHNRIASGDYNSMVYQILHIAKSTCDTVQMRDPNDVFAN